MNRIITIARPTRGGNLPVRGGAPARWAWGFLILAFAGCSGADQPPAQTPAPFDPHPIGHTFTDNPRIAHVAAVDLDRDGMLDVVVCDARADRVTWIRQAPRDRFEEHVLAAHDDPIPAPAHAQPLDIDNDGDLDLLVASLGQLFPSNEKIGAVYVMENDGKQRFHLHRVASGLYRVSDVRGGDLDGDGDTDLAVGMFGAFNGGTGWLENKGAWQFEMHVLDHRAGPIHVPVLDLDGDGDLDIALLLSQEFEEILFFLNDGGGRFEPRQVWGATNEDFGSSSLRFVDLDGDGRLDMLYTNGDAWDYVPPEPRPWHGVHWLRNTGGMQYRAQRLTTIGGPYAALPIDVDRDGRLDVVVACTFNDWEDPASPSLVCLRREDDGTFTTHPVTANPTHIQTAAEGDFNGDGRMDFVTGGMHTYPPHDRMSRVVLWLAR